MEQNCKGEYCGSIKNNDAVRALGTEERSHCADVPRGQRAFPYDKAVARKAKWSRWTAMGIFDMTGNVFRGQSSAMVQKSH